MEQQLEWLEHYHTGITLFNAGQYWEAHESWETCWRSVGEPDATFFKAIIQAAAALVHWQRGNERGLVRNYYKARPKLLALPSQMHGLNLVRLTQAMDVFVLTETNRCPPHLHLSAM